MNSLYKDQIKINFKGLTEKDIKYYIMDTMHHIDNNSLLNLGLLFVMVWKDANPIERKEMIKIIKYNVNKY